MPSRTPCAPQRPATRPTTRSRSSWCRLPSTVCTDGTTTKKKEIPLTHPQSSPRSASTRLPVSRSSNRPSKTSRPASQRRAATARSRWRPVPSPRTTTPSWRRSWRSASARTSRSAETKTRARATRARLPRRRRLRQCLYANDYDGPLSKVGTGVWGLTAMGRACMQHIGHVQHFGLGACFGLRCWRRASPRHE